MSTLMLERAELMPPPAPVSDPESILRYAIDSKADVSVIERLMVVRQQLRDEAAKAAFDAALAAFQAECPVIFKTKAVPDRSGQRAYSYSPFEEIICQTKELRQKHGFSFELDTDVESQPGWVIAICKVTHRAGHSRTSRAKFPLGKGTMLMSETQVYAAAMTFASRRVFCNAFGIVTSGEDADGRTSKPKPAGPSNVAPDHADLRALAKELWEALKPVRGPEHNWKAAERYCWDERILGDDETLPNLTAERFKQVIEKAKAKLCSPKQK